MYTQVKTKDRVMPIPATMLNKWDKIVRKHPNKTSQLIIGYAIGKHRLTVSIAMKKGIASSEVRDLINNYLTSL